MHIIKFLYRIMNIYEVIFIQVTLLVCFNVAQEHQLDFIKL